MPNLKIHLPPLSCHLEEKPGPKDVCTQYYAGIFKHQITQGGRPHDLLSCKESQATSWYHFICPYDLFSFRTGHTVLGSLQAEKLRYFKVIHLSASILPRKIEKTLGRKILIIIWVLTIDFENFIHQRAKYITLPRTLPTAKRLCLESNPALFHFTFALRLKEREQGSHFPAKVK